MVCHDLTYHLDGDSGTIPDPQVYLNDPDGGPSIIYDGTPESLTTFCINCHDSDGANGSLTPFSDTVIVPNVKGVAGSMWADSAHAQRGYQENGGNPITCFGDGMTTGCHSNAHGSDNDKLLAAGPEIDQFCYNCHTQGKVMNDAISNNRTGGQKNTILERALKSEVTRLHFNAQRVITPIWRQASTGRLKPGYHRSRGLTSATR
jgi:predicted CXXCH cytochrome family protein